MQFLIVKTSALGDIVQAYPVVEYLRRRFPQARIDWVVERSAASLVHSHPYVRTAIEVDMKKWKKSLFSSDTRQQFAQFVSTLRSTTYDALFDLQGNAKSALITAIAKAKDKVGFGWKTVPEKINCLATNYRVNPLPGENVRYDYLALARSYFQDDEAFTPSVIPLRLSSEDELIFESFASQMKPNSWLICPFSQWKSKELPSDTLIGLLKRASEKFHPHYIFLSGSGSEKERVQPFLDQFESATLFDRLPLPALQHLMHKMAFIVAMDSLPLHLAGSCGRPVIAFFGPSSSLKYAPLQHAFIVQGRCERGIQFEKRCPSLRSCPFLSCVKNIAVPNFIDQLDCFIKNNNGGCV